mmetsp:Transcript_52722/g.163781  ORF Transcript_52722/g.163781 Transcript_52722/m.163781 type:complete len:231 (-) Transcript_52722:345-1037(-)
MGVCHAEDAVVAIVRDDKLALGGESDAEHLAETVSGPRGRAFPGHNLRGRRAEGPAQHTTLVCVCGIERATMQDKTSSMVHASQRRNGRPAGYGAAQACPPVAVAPSERHRAAAESVDLHGLPGLPLQLDAGESGPLSEGIHGLQRAKGHSRKADVLQEEGQLGLAPGGHAAPPEHGLQDGLLGAGHELLVPQEASQLGGRHVKEGFSLRAGLKVPRRDEFALHLQLRQA